MYGCDYTEPQTIELPDINTRECGFEIHTGNPCEDLQQFICSLRKYKDLERITINCQVHGVLGLEEDRFPRHSKYLGWRLVKVHPVPYLETLGWRLVQYLQELGQLRGFNLAVVDIYGQEYPFTLSYKTRNDNEDAVAP